MMAEVAYPIRETMPSWIYYVQILQDLTNKINQKPSKLLFPFASSHAFICKLSTSQGSNLLNPLIGKYPISKQLRIICLKTLKTITSPAITSFKDMVEQLQHPEDHPKNFSVFLQWVGNF